MFTLVLDNAFVEDQSVSEALVACFDGFLADIRKWQHGSGRDGKLQAPAVHLPFCPDLDPVFREGDDEPALAVRRRPDDVLPPVLIPGGEAGLSSRKVRGGETEACQVAGLAPKASVYQRKGLVMEDRQCVGPVQILGTKAFVEDMQVAEFQGSPLPEQVGPVVPAVEPERLAPVSAIVSERVSILTFPSARSFTRRSVWQTNPRAIFPR